MRTSAHKDRKRKIIAISASPSRGRNSDKMLDAFIAGAEHNEDIEVEKYYLDTIHIEHYKFENRLGPQQGEENFAELTDKIRCADGLVISTPTYNFAVPAHLKNFVDRLRFIALDFTRSTNLGQPVGMMQNVSTYFLVSGGTPNWARKILFFAFPLFWLRGVFIYYGASYMGGIYSGDVRTYENTKVLEKCNKGGHMFADKLARDKCNSFIERFFWRPPQAD